VVRKDSVVRLQVLPASAVDEHQTKIVTITRKTIKLEEQAAKKRVIELTRNNKPYKIGVIFYQRFMPTLLPCKLVIPTIVVQLVMLAHLIEELKADKVEWSCVRPT